MFVLEDLEESIYKKSIKYKSSLVGKKQHSVYKTKKMLHDWLEFLKEWSYILNVLCGLIIY